MSDKRLIESDVPVVNLARFFYYEKNGRQVLDAASLLKFKQKVVDTVINRIFNSSSKPTQLNDVKLNMYINDLVRAANSKHGWNNIVDNAIYYFNNFNSDSKKRESLKDTDNLVDFFIATQMPLLIKSYLSDIIQYDSTTGKYRFAIKSHIKQDWNDERDEKPAELNGLLKLMCESTRMIGADGKELSKMRLTQNSFM